MSDSDDSTPSTAFAVDTPPESVIDEVTEELVRVKMQIEMIRMKIGMIREENAEENAAKRSWFCLFITNFLAIFLFVLTVKLAAHCFGAEPSNTAMSSVRINLPVQTVTTTVVATATVTATAAVTTQPPTFPIPGNVYMICSTISNQETWSGSVMTHLDDEVLLTTITDRRSHWL
ncbi:hypothetical protein E6O75_ATG02663 [Venturia nashicola]|uniref:Transmembrane protein n=1 Tax=Venturia nashicola TaxID=86259 RepID=A0A4Z1P8R0_9PEZI|nr:hypothetical protein E6O75_ATG02663 [Venturia nashicola]